MYRVKHKNGLLKSDFNNQNFYHGFYGFSLFMQELISSIIIPYKCLDFQQWPLNLLMQELVLDLEMSSSIINFITLEKLRLQMILMKLTKNETIIFATSMEKS